MKRLEEGRNCWRLVRADRAAFLVDGAAYFDAFARAAMRASASILIVGWDFNSRTRLWCEDAPPGVPVELGAFLEFLAKRRRGPRINILDWDFPMIYAVGREAPPVFGLGWQPRHRIELRFDGNLPAGGSHHQKIVVIDDAMAFVGGMDLTADRWDTPEHRARDARRTKGAATYPPVHDVMIAVDGEAARALGELARERWHRGTGARLSTARAGGDRWPDGLEPQLSDVTVAIARTEPAHDGRPEVREVERLYVDMLSAARRLVYIENQYFTSSRIGDAIEERLQQEDCPEIVIVLRQSPDGWLEGPTMGTLRALLVARLRRADRFGRLHLYCPTVPGLGDDCINVHAKLCVVDDELARVGSANLNNRSMGFDTECDVVVEARGDDAARGAIAAFRNRLLAEHLDVDPAEVAAALAREGSVAAAITALAHGERRLVPLPQDEDWPVSLAPIAELMDPERPVSADQLIEQFVPDAASPASGRPLLTLLLLVLTFGGLFAVWRWTPLSQYVTPAAVAEWASRLGGEPAGPFVVVAAYTLATVTMFPRPVITLVAVIAFGAPQGFAYAMIGMMAAALLTYSVGRSVSRHTVRRFAGARLNRLARQLRNGGLLPILTVRLLPVAPFVVVNVVAGAARVRVGRYALGTAIGILPGVLVATLLGGQLELILRDSGGVSYGLVAAFACVLLASLAARRYLRRRFAVQEAER